MLRKLLFVMVPMVLAVSVASADDSLSNLNLAEINDAAIEIDTASLADVDVEGLAGEAGSEKSEDAIEACFRRFGYGHRGYGYGYGYGYGCGYSYGYYPAYYCYRPYYPTYYCYSYPVVSYVSYWGCY